MFEIRSKLTIKTSERSYGRCSDVFTGDFKHTLHFFLVFFEQVNVFLYYVDATKFLAVTPTPISTIFTNLPHYEYSFLSIL